MQQQQHRLFQEWNYGFKFMTLDSQEKYLPVATYKSGQESNLIAMAYLYKADIASPKNIWIWKLKRKYFRYI